MRNLLPVYQAKLLDELDDEQELLLMADLGEKPKGTAGRVLKARTDSP